MASRAFGWIQDGGKIENLRRTVEIFDHQSPTYQELIEKRISTLVEERDGRDRLLTELHKIPLTLKYKDLVGTAFTPRRESRCNGIIQAAIVGQNKPFIVDWAASSFLKWAHALGFIQHNKSEDSFSITEFGRQYARATPGNTDGSGLFTQTNQQGTGVSEKEILSQAFLSYPPVMRVLNLLKEEKHLTKFEIGKQLGFVGEDGFTSLPQDILVIELAQTKKSRDRSEMLANWDGTSDKYARMIAGWLENIGWVKKEEKLIKVTLGNKVYEYGIPQSYRITADGLKARRRGLGINIQKRIPKNVFWEMLATKGKSRDYKRTRRALILQEIGKKSCSLQALQRLLADEGFSESEATIADDLKGLKQIGLNVQQEQSGYFLQDTIQNLTIPSLPTKDTVKDDIQKLMDQCRDHLEHVSHDYLVLIELSFSGKKKSRIFEKQTVNLLINECGFNGFPLGGQNRPDGLIFTQELTEDYGVIIDTKAYKDGFSLPIAEQDKMTRYVNQNLQRDKRVSLKWWEDFPADVNLFKFLFVSSKFIGEYESGLRQISISTQDTTGAAITSYNLLLLAEEIAKGKMDLQNVREKFSCLSSVEIASDSPQLMMPL